MDVREYDLIVIGGGPGGYTAAIRGAQLGLRVACIEAERSLGGTCLRIGCIPSKALLESSELFRATRDEYAAHGITAEHVRIDLATMLARKDKTVKQLGGGIDHLFKKNKVDRLLGTGRLAGAGRVSVATTEGPIELASSRILIATGSVPATLPGVAFDGDRIGTSTEALTYSEVPKHLIVIGAGAIGLELGSVWRRLGAKVTVLEYLDRILPEMDAEIAAEARRIFARQGLEFQLGCRVTGAQVEGPEAVVAVEGREPVRGDRVLVAVGRKPFTGGLGLETVGIALDPRGRIPVDEHFQTTVAGVWAIGDVIRGPMLAHKAEEEGLACVESMVTGYGHINYDAIPSIVYTQPEVAAVGRSEEQLQKDGVAYKKGAFPFLANGRALAIGHAEGRVKVLADAQTDRILGVHIVGPHAGDLIAEAAVAIEFAATSEDLARSTHAHPTLAECLKEAAAAVSGRAIHA
ncbi:MAG: dihydrolipoyl dehydrogenase [Pirellulales bacterium]|nr:dihydrolipoyl dehydrogenase [Pirellulales bacterium]